MYDDKNFEILGFPCDQFENQEPGATNQEILNSLYYVRPGHGFVANFTLFEKSDVNGATANPIWAWMRAYCSWIPQSYIMNNVRLISWSPVTGSDTAWNFEKILIDKKGIPYRRYSYLLKPLEMTEDIEFLLSQE
eukprot:TRINITY_DN840_c1_g6_i1.p1 TRINITY_DN840_c1_g6~~TRINITY_DN840_c1_g6_i1.p1  ORF type:complete len:135 (+),score=27.49 TRINITY_DN840_c1_g6_i1:307-711(+)